MSYPECKALKRMNTTEDFSTVFHWEGKFCRHKSTSADGSDEMLDDSDKISCVIFALK